MPNNKIIIVLTAVITLALLIPGLTQPMLTMKADLNRQALVQEGKKVIKEQSIHPAMASMATQFLDGLKVEGTSRIYDKTRSILGTASDLWQSGYILVAILIVTFSAIIPGFKTLLLLLAAISPKPNNFLQINSLLSKWSMADVYAIGVLIACLAANASSQKNAVIQFEAQLHPGYYWFVGYCLTSVLLSQLISKKTENQNS